MFKNSYQSGLLSIFYSCGANPLALWEMEVNNGHIKRITDNEVNSIVLEIVSTNVATTYMTCPKNKQTLGIKLPFLVMIVKNLKRYFSFEITILDDKNMRRRFRISNFQSTTKIKPFCTTMPIGLSGGWNQIQFNLSDFTRRAYGTQFIEALRVQVHANVRLRRIYFAERLYSEEELPQDYKLYLPLEKKLKKGKKKDEPASQVKSGTPAAAAASPVPPPVTETQAVEQIPAKSSAPVTPVSEVEETKSKEAPSPAPEAVTEEIPSVVTVDVQEDTEPVQAEREAGAEALPGEVIKEPAEEIGEKPAEPLAEDQTVEPPVEALAEE